MSFLALAPSLIGAGGSILSGLIGSDAQSQQRRLQAAIAQRQFAEQDQNRTLSLASQTDAEGNQVVFDPATNSWQTILTAPQKQLQTASDRENLLRITHDAAQARQQNDADFARRQKEGTVANNYLQDMLTRLQNPQNEDTAGAASRLAHNRDVLDAQNAALRGFETQGLRSGNNNILDAIDRSRAETGSSIAHNEDQALVEHGGPVDSYSKTGPLAQLYSGFASAATGGGGMPTNPGFTGGSALQNVIANNMRNDVFAGSGAGSVGNGYLQTLKPDYSGADSVLGISNGLSGFLKDNNVQNYLKGLFSGGGGGDGNAGFSPAFASAYSDGWGT